MSPEIFPAKFFSACWERLSPVLRYQVSFEPVASRRREFLLFSIHTNGQQAGESAQRKLPALAARFLRTGSARLSEAIGGLVSEGDSYCFL